MKSTFPLLISILMVLNWAGQTTLADFPDSTDVDRIRTALAYTFNEDYIQAQNLIENLNNKYPDHPCGTFFTAAALLARMSDREHFENDKYFNSLIKQSISRADKLRDNNPNSAWAYYFMGMANFYQALQDTRKGKKWSVLKNGMRGKNLLNRALDLDSTLYEAYFGLGNYHYWGSVKTRGYEWMPFVGDNRQQGIAGLHRASDSSLFSGDLAKSALIRVYYNEHQTDSAEALVENMISKFPNGKSFLWARAEGHFINENYIQALRFYYELAQKIEADNPVNKYNSLQIAYQKILCHYRIEQYIQALMESERILNLPLCEEVRKRHKNNLKEVQKIKEKILKRLSKEK